MIIDGKEIPVIKASSVELPKTMKRYLIMYNNQGHNDLLAIADTLESVVRYINEAKRLEYHIASKFYVLEADIPDFAF